VYIQPSRASQSAIKAIEKVGGQVVCKYYNDLALRDCIKGRIDRKSAAPTRKTDIGAPYPFFSHFFSLSTHALASEWYSDPRNRGYLSPLYAPVAQRWADTIKGVTTEPKETLSVAT
jgi:large subunit ribosomal protein L15